MGLRDFITVLREISFDDLENESRITPSVLVISTHYAVAKKLADVVFGEDAVDFVDAHAYDDPQIDPLHYDVIVTVGPLDPRVAREWRDRYRRVNQPWRLVEQSARAEGDSLDVEALRRRVADCADDRSIAIGRCIPAMRAACVQHAIRETATVNGQFALVSNVPTLLPVVGNVLAVGADFVVLTKNQLMLIFKLAAINGRDLDNRWRIYAEMLPVVGAGLAWRTVAREVVTLLPLAIGTIPKVAIAFAGTWAIGEAAQAYYERGERLNREQMHDLYARALDFLRQNPIGSSTRNPAQAVPGRLKLLRWRQRGEESLPLPEETD